MARYWPSRLGLVVGVMLAAGTFTSGASMAREGPDTTFSVSADYDYDLRLSLFSSLSGDLLPAAIYDKGASTILAPVGQKFAVKERASRSAVRPTAVAGWRSSRVRHLSAG